MTDSALVVAFLRSLRGWSREQLARAAGLHSSSIGRLEQGRTPRPGTLESIRRAFGLSPGTWQRLLDLIADLRHELSLAPPVASSFEAEPLEDALSVLAPRVFAAFTALPSASVKAALPPHPTAADRSRANELWERLRPLCMPDRRELISVGEEYSCWALAERLAKESEKIALKRATDALALAGLADRIAETAPMPSRFRARLRALTTAYLGYARRAAGHLPGAETAFRRSEELWTLGAGGDPTGLLDGSFRLALKSKGPTGDTVRKDSPEAVEG